MKPSSVFHPVTWERVNLQRIREGIEQVFPEVGEEAILIPEDMCCQGDTIDSLVDEVYGDLGRFTNS